MRLVALLRPVDSYRGLRGSPGGPVESGEVPQSIARALRRYQFLLSSLQYSWPEHRRIDDELPRFIFLISRSHHRRCLGLSGQRSRQKSMAREALKQCGDELFARFAACYADLRALPRGARRSLQRRIARSERTWPRSCRNTYSKADDDYSIGWLGRLAGAALLLALGQGVGQRPRSQLRQTILTS